MTNNSILKRFYISLLIAVCFFFAVSPANAAVFDILTTSMEEYCGGWDEAFANYSGSENCWACQIFMLIFDAANTVAGHVNSALSGPLSSVIVSGCGLWILFHTVVFFGNFSNPEPAEYLTKVGGILLKVVFGLMLIKGGASMAFTYIVNPVLTAGARLATNSISTTGSGLGVSIGDISGSMSGPLGGGVRSALKQMIESVSASMAQSQAIAFGLRCGAPFWMKIIDLIPVFNPLMFVVGAFLGCIFWAIAILFSFALLDVIFRIGLLVGMMPVFIAAWVFPVTASYAQTAWVTLLHCGLTFFVTGIMASLMNILVQRAWGPSDSNTGFNEFMTKMHAGQYVEAWDSLFDSGIGGGLGAICLVICIAFWAWFLTPKADSMASKFVEGFTSSCALKAIKMIISLVMDLLMLIISLCTFGLGSLVYSAKVVKVLSDNIERAEEIAEKIKKVIEKIRKMRERMQKMVEKMMDLNPDA